jgi:glucose/arabinose dehydrogenase
VGSDLVRTTASWRAKWRILLAVIAGLVVGFLPLLFLPAEPVAATVRPGFEDRLVASVDQPIGLTFLPDGRMLVASQGGKLWLHKNGQLLQTPALDISSRICSDRESGMLGVAVDPEFGTAGHNYVYLSYTFKKSGTCPTTDWTSANADNPVNRVSRFVMSGDTIDPASEEVLIDNIPSPTGYHYSY